MCLEKKFRDIYVYQLSEKVKFLGFEEDMSRQDGEEKGGPERHLEETAFAPVIPTLSLVQYRSFSILAPTDDSIEPILEFLVNPKQDAPVNFESRS